MVRASRTPKTASAAGLIAFFLGQLAFAGLAVHAATKHPGEPQWLGLGGMAAAFAVAAGLYISAVIIRFQGGEQVQTRRFTVSASWLMLAGAGSLVTGLLLQH